MYAGSVSHTHKNTQEVSQQSTEAWRVGIAGIEKKIWGKRDRRYALNKKKTEIVSSNPD